MRHRPTSKPRRGKRQQDTAAAAEASPERLQKVMAGAGLGSRRALENHIRAGAVRVNRETAELGSTVQAGDRIRFQDREWRVAVATDLQHRCLIYNKPEGELTTRSDPDGRPTVFDHLPFVKNARWVAVGRLDINTTGLLLLTTDGELTHAMMHPSNQVDREYVCRIRGQVSDEQLAKLKEGVLLDDGPARFSDIQRTGGSGENHWFQVTILEGRNREVRRLWESQGCMVSRLKRVRYGAARLPKGLRMGKFSELTPREHQILREDVGLPAAAAQLTLHAVKSRRPANKPGGKSPRGKQPPKRSPSATAKADRSSRNPGGKPGRTVKSKKPS